MNIRKVISLTLALTLSGVSFAGAKDIDIVTAQENAVYEELPAFVPGYTFASQETPQTTTAPPEITPPVTTEPAVQYPFELKYGMYVTFRDAGTGDQIDGIEADIVRTHYKAGKAVSQEHLPFGKDTDLRLMYKEDITLESSDEYYVFSLEDIELPEGYWIDEYYGDMNSGKVDASSRKLRTTLGSYYFSDLVTIYLANADTPAKTTVNYSGTRPQVMQTTTTTTTAPRSQTTTTTAPDQPVTETSATENTFPFRVKYGMYVSFRDAGTGETVTDADAELERLYYKNGELVSDEILALGDDTVPRKMYTEDLTLESNDEYYVFKLKNISIPDGYWIDEYYGDMDSGKVDASSRKLNNTLGSYYFSDIITIYLANKDTPAKTTPSYTGTTPPGYYQTTTSSLTPAVTTTAPVTVSHPGNVRGDANGDGDVDIADSVLIMQYLANSEKYSISRGYEACADCVDKGSGITAVDALAVQLVEAKTLTAGQLPITSEQLSAYV